MALQSSFMVKTLVVGRMATNCYLLIDTETSESIIVDPGDDPEFIMENLSRLNALPQAIIATHGHFDHILGGRALQAAYNLPFLLGTGDTFLVERMQLSAKHYLGLTEVNPPPQVSGSLEKTKVRLGHYSLAVISTPGHTPGSMSFYFGSQKVIFVGDTLFAGGGVGRTDFSYSSQTKLNASIAKILSLPEDTLIYPGHGESTTIGPERRFHSV